MGMTGKVVFFCETDKGIHEKEVLYTKGTDGEAVDNTADHVEWWIGGMIRDGETVVRWWAEDNEGRTIRDFGDKVSVYVNKHGKLKRR